MLHAIIFMEGRYCKNTSNLQIDVGCFSFFSTLNSEFSHTYFETLGFLISKLLKRYGFQSKLFEVSLILGKM